MNIIEYKGFQGTIEYSSEDACLIGEVLGTGKSVIGYAGESISEITQMFHQAVDDYLEHCQEYGIKPEIGAVEEDLNLHLGKDLLETAKTFASNTGQSLNDFIVSAIKRAVSLN